MVFCRGFIYETRFAKGSDKSDPYNMGVFHQPPRRLKADWFLTDDIAARVLANSINLECHGSLGIVLWASAVGNLNYQEAKTALDKLFRHSSLWVSRDVVDEAYEVLEKMF